MKDSGIQLDHEEYKSLRKLIANVMFKGDEAKVPDNKAAIRFALNFAVDRSAQNGEAK